MSRPPSSRISILVIGISISPAVLARGRATKAVISVANRSPNQTAYGVVVEFEPDSLIRLDHGTGRIEIDELRPGTVDDSCRVTLTGRSTGIGKIEFPHVTYQTSAGWVIPTIPPLAIQIEAHSEPDRPDGRSSADVAATPRPPSAFISHRHADSGWLGQLVRAQLKSLLPSSHIFLDYDNLAPGDLWSNRIDQELGHATAMLALIGPNWETVTSETGARRLHLREDVVRHEVVTALRRRILVIPILHDRSTLPRAADLPHDLHPLLAHQYTLVDHRTQSHAIRKVAIRLRGAGLF
jgi:hypothetical protein